MRPRVGAALIGLSVLALACAGDEPDARAAAGLDTETFIQVFIDLREADYLADTPEAFAAMKDSIMAEYDTTPDDLREFVRVTSGDVDRMSAIWDSIEVRIRRIARADTVSG